MRLMPITRCHSASSTRWAGPPPATPAAVTVPSMRPPPASTPAATSACTARLVGDVGADVGPPLAEVVGSSARSAPTTVAPSASSRRAVARPMPDAAPVTITTLPSTPLIRSSDLSASCTTCAMRFALFYEIPVARPWGPDSERLAYQHTIEQALAGERYGWDAFWTVEHHFLEEYSHCSNPEVLYGAIAAQTERMRLGFGVRLMPKPYNHPVRTAESVAVLDLISNGRVDLGTGRSLDPRRARGLRHRPGRDARHVAGGDRPRRRLLDQRHLLLRGRALVDAAAARAAEADPAAPPADLGRHQLRRRPPAGRRARPRAVLVRGRRAARRR